MEFETATLAAERMGVKVRTIQKWASSGKLAGAYKKGNIWMIPKNADAVENLKTDVEEKSYIERNPMPMLSGNFEPGNVIEYIESLKNDEEKCIAYGEYYYATGRRKEAVESFIPFLNNEVIQYRLTPLWICIYSKIYCSDYYDLDIDLDEYRSDLKKSINESNCTQEKAILIFVAHAMDILFHIEPKNIPPLDEYLKYLPKGIQLFAFYIMSYKAYTDGEYERGYVIAEMAILTTKEMYPLPMVYNHIMAAANLLSLNRIKEAKKYLKEGWKIAEKDNFIQPFGKHYGLLLGLAEAFFKKEEVNIYKKMIEIYTEFDVGWKKIHNKKTSRDMVDNLTHIEFIIAMLFCKNWKISEIAEHIGIKERNVKMYLQAVYQKLAVTSKKELTKYMI